MESGLQDILDERIGTARYRIEDDGRVSTEQLSTGLLSMLGCTRQEYDRAAGRDVLDMVFAGDRKRLRHEIAAALEAHESLSTTCRVRHKEKGHIWVNLFAAPYDAPGQGCVRYSALITNASHQFELHRELLDIADTGLMVTDRATREIYFTNQVAKRIIADAREQCGCRDGCPIADDPDCPLCDASSLLPPEDTAPRKLGVGGRTYQVHTHFIQWMDRPAVSQYFADITEESNLQERISAEEERYRLVVEKSGLALVDYDRRTGKVYMNDRFKQYAASEADDLGAYFQHAAGSETVHPDDAAKLDRFYLDLAQQRCASARIRLKMVDGTYRWTDMGALELMDEQGRPLRKIGFFRDVDEATRQYDDLRIRYDYEMTRQNSFEEGVVERMLLDLTDNKVVQASNPANPTLPRLAGTSVEDLLKARLAHTQGEREREELRNFMDRDKLLNAYYKLETPSLQMISGQPGSAERRYFLSTAQIARNPGNGHIIAFIETRDNDRAVMESSLMKRLLETSYESAVVVNAETGSIKIGISEDSGGFSTDIRKTYGELSGEVIAQAVAPEERARIAEEVSLAAIRQKLEDTAQCSGRATLVQDGKLSYKTWTAAFFDDEKAYILITVANVTDIYKRDLEMAEQLRSALESAEVASKAKSTFLARMSHEIRTPITTVSGILDLMGMAARTGSVDPGELLEQIETANAANQYLLTLVNDILDISRIESNEMTLSPVPTDIRTIIPPICAMVRPLADKKHIDLVLERKTTIGNWYLMDATRVQQVVMNLLSNAIKFTPEGGTVTFTGEARREGPDTAVIAFTVSDTGIGIGDGFKDQVFELFRREHSSADAAYEGTGIGLAISRSLARLMGGDITFTSEQGKGSTFTATMRLGLLPEQACQDRRPGPDRPATLDGLRILLCEDNKVNQAIVRKLLEGNGAEVRTADNGQQAVDQVRDGAEGFFDLVLMDIRMPVCDGLEATRRIRALPRADAAALPILAMSANAYEEDRQESLAAGMNDHLSKPVEAELLKRTILQYAAGGAQGSAG